jgi:hypothetical protein
MLRPMVATTAVTAALILLAGCGGDDKKADSGSENTGGQSTSTSSTPSTPTVPTFDPPKAFTASAAYPVPDYDGRGMYDEPIFGMVGEVALVGNYRGLTGRDVADPSKAWEIKAAAADTTTVSDTSGPMAAKVDGKDVAVIAYAESDKGNGTQKPSGLVVVHWIDVLTGQKIAEVSAKVSTVQGTGVTASGTPSLAAAAVDPETGQIAVGVSTAGTMNKYQTVYADPATQKSTIVPDMNPAAVHSGVVAGTQGAASDKPNGAVRLVDGASGKVTKQVPLNQAYLEPLAGGSKHAYFYGHKEVSYTGGTKGEAIFVVDVSTGAVTQTVAAAPSTSDVKVACLGDQATSVVCTSTTVQGHPLEIAGFDDTTGKKVWGFTDASEGRVVPRVTAAFHGVVYAQTEAQPVLLDAKTGQDLPSSGSSSSPSASSSDSPSTGETPSGSDSPTSSDTPSDTKSAGGSDMSLYNGKPGSPDAVSPYGAVYGQLPQGGGYGSSDLQLVMIYLKPTA